MLHLQSAQQTRPQVSTTSQHNFVTLTVRQSAQLLCYTYSQTTSQHNYSVTLTVRPQSAHYFVTLTDQTVSTATLLHLQSDHKSAQLLCYTYSQTTSQHNYFVTLTVRPQVSTTNLLHLQSDHKSAQLLCYTYSQTTSQHNYFVTLTVRPQVTLTVRQSAQLLHLSAQLLYYTYRPQVRPQVSTTTMLHLQ